MIKRIRRNVQLPHQIPVSKNVQLPQPILNLKFKVSSICACADGDGRNNRSPIAYSLKKQIIIYSEKNCLKQNREPS